MMRRWIGCGWLCSVWLVCVAQGVHAADAPSLLSLAETRWKPLAPNERLLVESIAAGQVFEIPKDGDTTPLRAEVLQWLCADPAANALLPRQGVMIINARFTGPLKWRYLKLTVPLLLQQCELESIDLDSAEVVALSLSGSRVQAFRGDQLRIQRDLELTEGFRCAGELRLPFAWIEGHLDCSGAELLNTTSDALFGDGMRVDGDLRLREGCKTSQRILLTGVRIAGNLDCDRSQLANPSNIALSLAGARINGDWTMRDATIEVGVVCHGAFVQGDLDGDRSKIRFPTGTAFRGYALEVSGDLRFVGASIAGDVLLEAVDVGRDLNFADAHFDTEVPPVMVTLQGMTAVRRFRWTDVTFRPEAPVHLDLRSATVGILYDDESSWPPEGHLRLQGFDYSEIHDDSPFDAESRIRWLRRQHTERFRTQPYDHMNNWRTSFAKGAWPLLRGKC
jgi:hypothetical protein